MAAVRAAEENPQLDGELRGSIDHRKSPSDRLGGIQRDLREAKGEVREEA